jgi:hypothetical protein
LTRALPLIPSALSGRWANRGGDPTLLEPAETPGLITPFMFLYALHDALLKPMPGKSLTPSIRSKW